MGTNFFFNGSWAGQLLVGVGLFGCSFFLEYRILIHFVTPASLALCLAITLEGGKVAAIIWHYYLGYLQSDSYAYRPGRSVEMALVRVRERIRIGQSWLVDADIRSFFDEIPYKQLIRCLKTFIGDTPTMTLIQLWLAQGVHHASMLGKRRGISQGAILSPLFCNLYLTSFDNALSKHNIPFVRFADDFLLFADKRTGAENALNFAARELGRIDLQLHPEKTRIIRSSPRVIFLGQRLPHPR